MGGFALTAKATRPAILAGITTGGVVAVGRRVAPLRAPAIAEALAAGGVRAFELTLTAFSAGFIAARLEALSFERALEYANAGGAAAAASLGDQTGLPDRNELLALLASGDGAPDTRSGE